MNTVCLHGTEHVSVSVYTPTSVHILTQQFSAKQHYLSWFWQENAADPLGAEHLL